MKQFKIPELGENISSAVIVGVLVKVGDEVSVDQPVLELETDKATIEVPSDVSGLIVSLNVSEGDKVTIGQVVFEVNEAAGAPAAAPPAAAVEAPAPVADKDATPAAPPAPSVPEAVAATPSAPAATTSTASAIHAVPPASPAAVDGPSHAVVLVENQPPMLQNSAPAAPSVRRLAREIGVNINDIKGTGPGGRISLDDVKAYSKLLHETRAQQTVAVAGAAHYEPLPDFSKYGTVVAQPMSNIRLKTAQHLSNAWQTIPHVTQFDKADITELEKFRKSYAKQAEKQGVKLTVTAILVKIITSALKRFPQFNSSVDMTNQSIIYKNYYNIGIAVDTEFGLIVPVIKNADQMNVIEISKEMNALAEKARNKKVSVADLQGGCFTITNLGGIGGTAFTPIVNAPEVAILGVSRGAIEPVWIDGKFEPRMMLPFSLSYDHRVIDGADGIRFLRWIIDAIENPYNLIVNG
ncbi:MAG: branched-chain alpha-keto acid dehydrogenase subunit E2 [Paludibacter sp. 47-17]|nr:MAG: branched-chain alpha-keto acid dehydrogenase subunit E2 [Paludibacter sp. SCN 51-9]OJX91538.1 MAG: branched-chain alpha-keto acid dehydrogenase subunit E2 [Paludibacter sp. 47-17]